MEYGDIYHTKLTIQNYFEKNQNKNPKKGSQSELIKLSIYPRLNNLDTKNLNPVGQTAGLDVNVLSCVWMTETMAVGGSGWAGQKLSNLDRHLGPPPRGLVARER